MFFSSSTPPPAITFFLLPPVLFLCSEPQHFTSSPRHLELCLTIWSRRRRTERERERDKIIKLFQKPEWLSAEMLRFTSADEVLRFRNDDVNSIKTWKEKNSCGHVCPGATLNSFISSFFSMWMTSLCVHFDLDLNHLSKPELKSPHCSFPTDFLLNWPFYLLLFLFSLSFKLTTIPPLIHPPDSCQDGGRHRNRFSSHQISCMTWQLFDLFCTKL